MLTREEFIGRAADAILRNMGYADPDSAPGSKVLVACADAQVALEAVGAWALLEASQQAADFMRAALKDLVNVSGFDPEEHVTLKRLRAAIARAEGR